jgi:hypothetical protein
MQSTISFSDMLNQNTPKEQQDFFAQLKAVLDLLVPPKESPTSSNIDASQTTAQWLAFRNSLTKH